MPVDHSLQMGLSDEWTVLAVVGSEETSQGLVCNQHCFSFFTDPALRRMSEEQGCQGDATAFNFEYLRVPSN